MKNYILFSRNWNSKKISENNSPIKKPFPDSLKIDSLILINLIQ